MNDLDNIRQYLAEQDAKRRANRKQPYRKPESIKELERLHYERQQARNPGFCHLKTMFRDDSSNSLTQCIVAWLELHGHFAGRVNTTGIYNQKLKKYIHSGSRRGMADITSVVDGKHVSIEIKHGRDKMRPEQLKVKAGIEAAGGIFIVASSFDNFLEQIKLITQKAQ